MEKFFAYAKFDQLLQARPAAIHVSISTREELQRKFHTEKRREMERIISTLLRCNLCYDGYDAIAVAIYDPKICLRVKVCKTLNDCGAS